MKGRKIITVVNGKLTSEAEATVSLFTTYCYVVTKTIMQTGGSTKTIWFSDELNFSEMQLFKLDSHITKIKFVLYKIADSSLILYLTIYFPLSKFLKQKNKNQTNKVWWIPMSYTLKMETLQINHSNSILKY